MRDSSIIQYIQPHFTHIVNRICDPDWELDMGQMKAHNLMYIYEGEGHFTANEKDFIVSKGALLYYKPGDMRSAWVPTRKFMKAFAMDFNYVFPIYREGQWILEKTELPLDTLQSIDDPYVEGKLVSQFDSLVDAWITGKRDKIAMCRNIFTSMISLIMDWKSGHSFDSTKSKKVEKVIQYMTDNFHQRMTLKELASLVNISPSYLSSIFREITGDSPVNYLLKIRMLRAKNFLLEGISVSDTALRSGFSDVHYFSKYFKKHEGLYPTQYRKAMAITEPTHNIQ